MPVISHQRLLRRAILGSVFAIVIALSPAVAQRGADPQVDAQIATRIKPEWRVCKNSADCGLISYDCSGIMAFNKEFGQEVGAVVYRFASPAWNWCDTTHEREMPICNNHQCDVSEP
jgi:hypothetical protein